MTYRLGIDVGGTFTDLFLVDEHGNGEIYKTPSTPSAPADGFFRGISEIAKAKGQGVAEFMQDVTHIMHGTTITTNATLTNNGARTALITTRGFRDIFLMRRGVKTGNQYDYTHSPEPSLIPRHDIFEVEERIDQFGSILTPLNEKDVRDIASKLRMAKPAFEAVAINLMWSFANPAHEKRIVEILKEELPSVYISVSSEVLPQVRIYERGSTTALNAYVGPILSTYWIDLQRRLTEIGYAGTLMIVQSNGGVMSPALTAHFAVNTLLSGPAGGPEAGLLHGRLHGLDNLITVDMGGTSFDVAMIQDGQAITTTESDINGYRVALPVLDIHTIGAGGGSIASVKGGLLEVGPQSAGSEPGPACYGRGGLKATTTDADLLLGYLDPAGFAGGRFPLNVKAAEAAMSSIADGIGKTVLEAASGVYDVVNHGMADAVRAISVERGLDPREFALIVAGGAGPLHAGPIARELEIPLVLIPRESSVFCASGMAVLDIRHDYVQSFPRMLTVENQEEANAALQVLKDRALNTLREEGVADENVRLRISADLRYPGQFNEVETASPLEYIDAELLALDFHNLHESLYGYSVPTSPIEIMNVRVRAIGREEKRTPASKPKREPKPRPGAHTGSRKAWFDGEMIDTAIIDGLALQHGNVIAGPAIIEQPTTTIVVPPGYTVSCDARENYVMHPSDMSIDDAVAYVADAQKVSVGKA